ncbi:MAG: carboxypeptidase M32 [Bacteroidia bacterium]
MNKDLLKYYDHLKEIANLVSISSTLHWDQEVNMPLKASTSRANQLSLLSGLIHEKQTDPRFFDLLMRLQEDESLSDKQKRSIQKTKQILDRTKKLSNEFVRKVSAHTSNTFTSWLKAREENSFSVLLPNLSMLIELKQEEATLYKHSGNLYDALLHEYEPGMTSAQLDPVFSKLTKDLSDIISSIDLKEDDDSILRQFYPKSSQWKLGMEYLKFFGFDFSAGRQDISEHPFTIAISNGDIRITTRIDENNLGEMFWSSLHEMGHALYEQSLMKYEAGAPESESCSLSIHESQSRFWENHIGRSKEFISKHFSSFQSYFPENLSSISADTFYSSINVIKPNLIRTSADELTYHTHVYIRYKLEQGLINGTLEAKNLKEEWNNLYKSHLGLIVPNDRSGVLQDVHWAHGSFGYFPTYTLGSLYAAQFSEVIQRDVPGAFKQMDQAGFRKIINWLDDHIYSKGRLFDSNELCIQISGEPLNADAFIRYAKNKYSS